MAIKALIPVRAGSQRVKNKNIRPFAGSSLLEIKIKQMQRIKELDGVIVNSDSDEMLELAESLGAETVKRDPYFASSTVSINEVYVDLANHCDADLILFADATNPLIKDNTVRQVIHEYFKNINNQYDSCNTVDLVKLFMWKDGKPLNYSEKNKPRSQDLPAIYSINAAVNLLSKDVMIKNRSFIGTKPYFVHVEELEGLDIDNEIDFEFAEFMYKKYRMNEYV